MAYTDEELYKHVRRRVGHVFKDAKSDYTDESVEDSVEEAEYKQPVDDEDSDDDASADDEG